MSKRKKICKDTARYDKLYAIYRIAFGIYFAFIFGFSKLFAGPEKWEGLGSAMELFGIPGGFVVFGFLAAFVESIGALLISTGVFTRLMAAGLTFTMIVAVVKKFAMDGDPTKAIIFGILSLVILIIGSGKISLHACCKAKKKD